MVALVGYFVATVISAIWASSSFAGISGPALTFVTFLLAQIVFTVWTGHHLGPAFRFARAHPGGLLLLNALTLASWLFIFMALQRIEASVESAVYQGAVAIVGFLLATLLAGRWISRATVGGLAVAAAAPAVDRVRGAPDLPTDRHQSQTVVRSSSGRPFNRRNNRCRTPSRTAWRPSTGSRT